MSGKVIHSSFYCYIPATSKTICAQRPVSQDISEPDEWEPFRFILALMAGFFGTIPIYPDSSGSIFGNHQDISEPSRRSLFCVPICHGLQCGAQKLKIINIHGCPDSADGYLHLHIWARHFTRPGQTLLG